MTLRPIMGAKIAKIEAALRYDSPVTQWERERLVAWRDMWFGSEKQVAVVNRIGEKLFGSSEWESYSKGESQS